MSPNSASIVHASQRSFKMFASHLTQDLTKGFPTITGIRWFNLAVLVVTPAVALYGLLRVPILTKTAISAVCYYIYTMLGTLLYRPRPNFMALTVRYFRRYYRRYATALRPEVTYLRSTACKGYHRLWSHRSYNASYFLQVFLILAGASAVQGSCYWWARRHRSHHRYTDTDLDPHNSERGLLWTHIGWIVFETNLRVGPAEITDLKNDPLVQWQHRWYFLILSVVGYLLPTCIPGLLWNDWRGGFFFVGALRMTASHHVSVFDDIIRRP